MFRASTILSTIIPALALVLSACDPGEGGDATNEPRNAEAAEHATKMMSHLDADGSGSISAAEAKDSRFSRHFEAADLDADGQVDQDELQEFSAQMAEKHHGEGPHADHECDGKSCSHHGDKAHECDGKSCPHHGDKAHECDGSCSHHGGGHHGKGMMHADPAAHTDKMLEHHDTNKDGSISKGEAADSPLAEKFADLDGDADGSLSRAELEAAVAAKMEKMKAHHAEMKDMTPEQHAAKMLEKLDKNGDGSVAKDEVAGTKMEKKFEHLDVNGDGTITSEEMVETVKAHHEKMSEHGKGHHGGKGHGPKGHHGPKGDHAPGHH
jgi:Ca2+-binding EF-hand superfamily protein